MSKKWGKKIMEGTWCKNW